MGKLVSFNQSLKQRPDFVLVLAKTELSWIKVARQLEQDQGHSKVMASYYLLEQVSWLIETGLINDYSACIITDCEGFSQHEQQQLADIASLMPLISVKRSKNVVDLRWQELNCHTVVAETLSVMDLPEFIGDCLQGYLSEKPAMIIHQQKVQSAGDSGGYTIVANADCVDAESFLADIVDSLRVVARTRGIEFNWSPLGVNVDVLLQKQQVQRHLVDMFLQIFDVFASVTVQTSSRSLLLDQCIWLDIVADKPRFQDDLNLARSEPFQELRESLRVNQGDLSLLEADLQRLRVRMEWHTVAS